MEVLLILGSPVVGKRCPCQRRRMPMLKINERPQYIGLNKTVIYLEFIVNTVCNLNVLKLYDCLLNASVRGFMAPSFHWLAVCSPVLFS